MSAEPVVRILFVCTANVCRSPLAEGLMTKHAKRLASPIVASSASVDSVARIVHPIVVKLLAEQGIEPSHTESQPLDRSLVDGADLVLTMTAEHALAVAGRHREATHRVFMLDHFAHVAPYPDPGSDIAGWLAALYQQPRLYGVNHDAHDIEDPIGGDETTFRRIATQIDALTARVADLLAPAPASPSQNT